MNVYSSRRHICIVRLALGLISFEQTRHEGAVRLTMSQ